jgi:NAD(P)-dependent dehydrogenase (short-subunit alcohol dehydrogenase family)
MSKSEPGDRTGSAVVVGVGAARGLGAALARRFAREGLHVVIAARTEANLEAVAAEIRAAGGAVTTVPTDATDEAAVRDLMQQADGIAGGLALAVFNAGNNFRKDILDISAEEMENLWRICCLGGFITGREAGRILTKRGAGTILFTGATASLRARPPFTAFASAKFALRAVAQAMARDFGPRGVHVGHVVIDGGILGEKLLSRVPDILEKREAGSLLDIDHIADTYWHLHQQKPTAWSFEVDLRPSVETF